MNPSSRSMAGCKPDQFKLRPKCYRYCRAMVNVRINCFVNIPLGFGTTTPQSLLLGREVQFSPLGKHILGSILFPSFPSSFLLPSVSNTYLLWGGGGEVRSNWQQKQQQLLSTYYKPHSLTVGMKNLDRQTDRQTEYWSTYKKNPGFLVLILAST